MFRPFLPYGMCAAAAAFLAYLLTRPLDFSTVFQLLLIVLLLTFPLLLRWHYPLLILSFLMPVSVFFLKGDPPLWMLLLLISLGISWVERAIRGRSQFIFVPQIIFPLLALAFVVFMTAELTGGLGFRALGSDVFGGKKYAFTFADILAYFAVVSRPIPPEKARLYTGLFLLGSLPSFIGDLAAVLPGSLGFIYMFIAPGEAGLDDMGNYTDLEVGVSRMGGFGTAALAIFVWMLARYGVRGIFLTGKPWRIGALCLMFAVIGFGGFRSAIMQAMMIFLILFFMEKLHRTPLVLVFLLGGVLFVGAMMPFASKLPFVIQRSLAFLPLSLTPEAVQSAQGSSDWRMNMWIALLPEVPKHLLLGKGFAIPTETFNEMMDGNAIANNEQIDSGQQSLALSGDYHNGPLSVVLPFGIWGVLAFGWFMGAAIWVLYRNYKFGDRSKIALNRFLLAYFIVKLGIFMTVFGAIQTDLCSFTTYVGFSIAINNGVCRESEASLAVRANRTIFAGRLPPPPEHLPTTQPT